MTRMFAGLALMTLLGCGTADVAGEWDATEGEQTYLKLQQDGDTVSGVACETEDQDCYDIEGGTIDGDVLTFSYSFDDVQVDAELTIDGDRLSGELRCTGCKAPLPHTYERR